MTKTYPIIHLNDYMYMVDKPCLYLKADEMIIRGWYPPTGSFKEEVCQYKSYMKSSHECRILASNDPSLNLPLLPKRLVDEIKETLNKVDRVCPHLTQEDRYRIHAAFSKKYTEEDIDKALVMKNMGYGKAHILKTLNPKPTSGEVEMVHRKLVTESMGIDEIWSEPEVKVVNNIIQIVKYMYD